MLADVTVNWGALLVAGVVNMVLGALWYSPMVFGKDWMKLMSIKEMKPNPVTMLGMFIVALLIGWVLACFVAYAGATTFGLGMEVGLMAAVGFVVLTGISGTMASKTSWNLLAINAGYWVVSLALMGGIIASMR